MSDMYIEVMDSEHIASCEIEKTIFEIEKQIESITSKTDMIDYFVSVASGIVCGLMDILWVGDFDLTRGRNIAEDETKEFVKKVAKLFGYEGKDLTGAVAHLEDKFRLPADGNTPDFGGGLQHHLRDFAHHPTITGLIFSLLTQFTEKSYGTDTAGNFIVVPVPDKSKAYIGKNPTDKIFKGTVVWFFHLVSDIAGSSGTASVGGGTGIPGPILAIAKELSVLPAFRNIKVEQDDVTKFLSKVFNGTVFAKRDENGKIIKETVVKFDFRGEMGVVEEISREALPVIANECIVRTFYFLRHLILEIKNKSFTSLDDIRSINWKSVSPFKNPTVTRMITIATGVFSAVDISEAILTKKYFVSVNWVGVGRFTVALGTEMLYFLERRDLESIKKMYESISQNTYKETDNKIYERISDNMDIEHFGLTLEQTEILYNIEYYKTMNDISATNVPLIKDKIVKLKNEWVEEWKKYMSLGFSGFVQSDDAVLNWYSYEELISKIKNQDPSQIWFRLVLLEAMLFSPYYALSLEKNKNGDEVPSKKYKELHIGINGYSEGKGDKYIEECFGKKLYKDGYIKRLRDTYKKVSHEMNEVLKNVIKGVAITAGVTLAVVITAGSFAPSIAVALVGSSFPELSGAALTSACLAYLGGGAIAVGGMGMAGGTLAIVGGGAILGVGVGAGVGGAVTAAGIIGKKDAIMQSAKLMTSVREIFLNDEKDVDYSNTVYEQYVENIVSIEKNLVDLKMKETVASKEEKKVLKAQIKNTEESVQAMKIAMKSMNKYNSAFQIGLNAECK